MRHPQKFIARLETAINKCHKGEHTPSKELLRLHAMALVGNPNLLSELLKSADNAPIDFTDVLFQPTIASQQARDIMRRYLRIADYIRDYLEEFGGTPLTNNDVNPDPILEHNKQGE